MDAIPLPFYEIAPLDDIARGVRGLRILFVNVFAVSTPRGGWTLIDTGLYLSAGKIKHWAEEHFGKGTKPEAIILTHGHFDHVGAAKDLLKEWNVPVYAHPAEFPYLDRTSEVSSSRSRSGRWIDGRNVANFSTDIGRFEWPGSAATAGRVSADTGRLAMVAHAGPCAGAYLVVP